MESTILALVVCLLGGMILCGYAVVRLADTLHRTRVELIDEAAEFNARMTAQGQPHAMIVPPPTVVEQAIYAGARVASPRWRRRDRRAAATRAAMGGVR